MFDPYADENGSQCPIRFGKGSVAYADGKAKLYVGYHKYLFAACIESCSYSTVYI
jgi:hypothetical protein